MLGAFPQSDNIAGNQVVLKMSTKIVEHSEVPPVIPLTIGCKQTLEGFVSCERFSCFQFLR